LSPFLWIEHTILCFHSSGILPFSLITPTNCWILFITSHPCLRNAAIKPKCPVLYYCLTSVWPAGLLVLLVPVRYYFPTLCSFGSVLYLVLLFYFCVHFCYPFNLSLFANFCSLLCLHRSVCGWYQSFIFCTILYACLGILCLNSSSIAIDIWLITCFLFFLHAVCSYCLFSLYSAPCSRHSS